MATRKPKTTSVTPASAKRKLSDEQIDQVVGDMKVPESKVKKTSTKETLSAKQKADEADEPYVAILSIELDPDNIGNGAFELDWNDKFITKLVRAGYQSKPNEEDSVIVDRWFQTVCKNIAMETFEQWESNQPYDARPRVIDRKNLGDGYSEAS